VCTDAKLVAVVDERILSGCQVDCRMVWLSKVMPAGGGKLGKRGVGGDERLWYCILRKLPMQMGDM
jgi:hypothetical protein